MPPTHTGAAIVLPLPARLAALVVLPGGEPADDLHCTLAFVGKAADLAPEVLTALRAELASIAAAAPPVEASLGGVARFSGEESDALVLTVDAPTLGALRAGVVEACERAGATVSTTHGFTPHVTVSYLAPDDDAPLGRAQPLAACFDRLALWLGDERTSWPLSPPASASLDARTKVLTLDAHALPDDFPPTEIKLFARGMNATTKGDFLVDDEACASVLAAFADHGVELAIDFDHGTYSEPGTKRDTAGWIGALEARDDGLYATKITWTEKGLAAIAPGVGPDGEPTPPEYRYHSPSIQFDAETRRVLALEPLGLVTFPASKGQRPLVMTATQPARVHAAPTETPAMKTRPALLTSLKLAATASDEEIAAAVAELKTAEEAESAALMKLLGMLGIQMSADVPVDPEKVDEAMGALSALKASVEKASTLEQRVASLTATVEKGERETLVAKGRAEGKLTAKLEAFYAAKPLAEFRGFLDAAPRVVAVENHEPPAAELTALAGKKWADLSAREKHTLSREQPELAKALKAAHKPAAQ